MDNSIMNISRTKILAPKSNRKKDIPLDECPIIEKYNYFKDKIKETEDH